MFFLSRRASTVWLIGVLLVAPGCAGKRKSEAKAAATKAAVAPREIGKIALVNPEFGFALIDVDMGFAPRLGTALKTFPHGAEPAPNAETSILTVSRERRPPFIAVDVVRGLPQKGDAVFQ